jgi:hypothetical protein
MALALAAAATTVGCGKKATTPPVTADAVTYWKDVKPLLDTSCMGCHQQGGIAPVALDAPAKAKAMANSMATETLARRMPGGWLAGEGCTTYHDDPSLTDAQIHTFQAWAAAGAPEGDPATEPKAQQGDTASLGTPNLTVQAAAPYSSPESAGTDDYHCFVYDPQLTEDHDVVAVDVQPDNARIVHHVILFEVEEKDLPKVQALDDAEPGEGYTCFGASGVNSANWVAAWAPGGGAVKFPDTTGIRLHKGSKLVMQVHYNLNNGRGMDQSHVKLYYSPAPVEHEALMLPIPQLVLDIPANQANVTVGLNLKITPEYEAKVWGVFGHMHLLGTRWKMQVDHADHSRDCLLTIPEWNFHWQRMYFLDTPVSVKAGDTIDMECTYDNSQAHQPTFNGVQRTSQETTWGENTTSEMCLGIVYVTKNY